MKTKQLQVTINGAVVYQREIVGVVGGLTPLQQQMLVNAPSDRMEGLDDNKLDILSILMVIPPIPDYKD